MTRLLKRVLALAAIAAVVAVVAFVTMLADGAEEGRRRPPRRGGGRGPVPVIDAPARIADVPVYLNGVGTAKARNTVTVRPQVDGRILSINFKEGQDVKRGDVLAKIDPATYQAQLDQAVAKKALDEAQLANAKRDLERYSQARRATSWRRRPSTRSARWSPSSPRRSSWTTRPSPTPRPILDYTTIVSPIDGRTGIRMVDEGNLVRAIDANAGIVVITEVRPIAVLFTLPQQQLAQVNAGAGARARDASMRSMPTARRRSIAARCRWSTTRSTRRPAPCA